MRFPVWAAAILLGACTFSSEAPFFDVGAAAFPIADGARFDWVEPFPAGERFDVTFHRTDAGYAMTDKSHPDEPMELLFVAIPETPEEDYIAQVRLENGDGERAYAFVWRTGDVFRIVSSPGSVEPGRKPLRGGDAYCHWRSYQECRLAGGNDLRALYRTAIYPRFVAGGDLPGSYTLLSPHELRLAPSTVQ